MRIAILALILAVPLSAAHAQAVRVRHPDVMRWTTVSPGVELKELTGRGAEGDARSAQASMALFRLAPGRVSAWSHNKVGEESFFVLRGRGEVWIGDRPQPVRQGSYVLIPPGAVRSIRASRDGALEYYALTTPAWSSDDDVHVDAPPGAPK